MSSNCKVIEDGKIVLKFKLIDGPVGPTPYERAIELGYEGSEEDWYASLIGPPVPVADEIGQSSDIAVSQKLLTDTVGVMQQANNAAVNAASTFANSAQSAAQHAGEQANIADQRATTATDQANAAAQSASNAQASAEHAEQVAGSAVTLNAILNSDDPIYTDEQGNDHPTLAGLTAEFPQAHENAYFVEIAATQVRSDRVATSQYAEEANSYANKAEAACDAAFVNANVYADEATGRAAVSNGQQFQVIGSGKTITRYRRDSESVSVKVAEYPSANSFIPDDELSYLGNLYDDDRIEKHLYLNPSPTTAIVKVTSKEWAIYRLMVSEGDTFTLFVGDSILLYPFKIAFFDKANVFVSRDGLKSTGRAGEYYIVVPDGAEQLLLNVDIRDATNNFNIRGDLKICYGLVDTASIPLAPIRVSSKIGSHALYDSALTKRHIRLERTSLSSRYSGKKIYTFGDSITEGSAQYGRYPALLEIITGAKVTNYGSSGARSNRLVGIMTDQPRRDSGGELPTPDYTDVSAVMIMIGTNDSSESLAGTIDQIPAGNLAAAVDTNSYLQSFPNNFLCNVAMCIEYVIWKNPSCDIYLISPPTYGYPTDINITRSLIPFLQELSMYYSVPLLNATYESGLSYKGMRADGEYSYDGTHPNELGVIKLADYIARKLAI